MIKHALTALSISLAPLAAQAGDPCPITVTIVDLGVPTWLDQAALLAAQDDVQPWFGFRSSQLATGRSIDYVHPHSPMERAGLTAGGLITKINGTSVNDDATYQRVMDTANPGDEMQLTVQQNGTTKRYSVTVGVTDPIPLGIAKALDTRDCSAGEIRTANDAEKFALQPFLYDTNRRFKCVDAHIDLGRALPAFTVSEAYILRGSRRIIIAMPPWGSTCINAADVSGSNLTTGNLLSLIDTVAHDYIADRKANP